MLCLVYSQLYAYFCPTLYIIRNREANSIIDIQILIFILLMAVVYGDWRVNNGYIFWYHSRIKIIPMVLRTEGHKCLQLWFLHMAVVF